MDVRHHVGTLSQIPDDEGLRVTVEGHNIALFRRDRRVYAVGDSCPHMGASLSEGFIDGKCVVCPWHGWIFDLETGVSPFDDDARVPVFRVAVEGEDVFIEVPAGAPDRCPSTPDRP
jgi:nitrite reductase/ring-hydroxylating ferredoxin subunit